MKKPDIGAALRLRKEIQAQQEALGFPYNRYELRIVMRYLLRSDPDYIRSGRDD